MTIQKLLINYIVLCTIGCAGVYASAHQKESEASLSSQAAVIKQYPLLLDHPLHTLTMNQLDFDLTNKHGKTFKTLSPFAQCVTYYAQLVDIEHQQWQARQCVEHNVRLDELQLALLQRYKPGTFIHDRYDGLVHVEPVGLSTPINRRVVNPQDPRISWIHEGCYVYQSGNPETNPALATANISSCLALGMVAFDPKGVVAGRMLTHINIENLLAYDEFLIKDKKQMNTFAPIETFIKIYRQKKCDINVFMTSGSPVTLISAEIVLESLGIKPAILFNTQFACSYERPTDSVLNTGNLIIETNGTFTLAQNPENFKGCVQLIPKADKNKPAVLKSLKLAAAAKS